MMTNLATDNQPLDAQGYLKDRVADQLSYYSAAATRAKRNHYWAQSIMIMLAAAVPVVVNLPVSTDEANVLASPKALATIMSLIVAILGGLTNFRKDGDLWLNFRRTEELLKQESFLFRTSAGPYRGLKTEEDRLAELSMRVESLISAEHNKFRSLIEDSRRPSKNNSEKSD